MVMENYGQDTLDFCTLGMFIIGTHAFLYMLLRPKD